MYFIIRFQVSGFRLKFSESHTTRKVGAASVPTNKGSPGIPRGGQPSSQKLRRAVQGLTLLKLNLKPETFTTRHLKRTCTKIEPIEI